MNQTQLFQILIKNHVQPNQWYLLCCIRSGIKPPNIDSQLEALICQQKGLLTKENKLTEKSLVLLSEIDGLFKKAKTKLITEAIGPEFHKHIKEYHDMFPMGQHPTMRYRYRTNKQELQDRFIWFFKTYPEYDWDTVLDATAIYIHQMAQHNHQTTSTASNFIKKTDINTRTFDSKLLSYCEMLVSGEYEQVLQQAKQTDFYKVRQPLPKP